MRRLLLLLSLIGGLLAGCGDAPADPYAAEKARQAWEWAQYADALSRVFWAGALLVGGLAAAAGLYALWGAAWWMVRGAAKGVQLVAPDAQGQIPYPAAYLLTDPSLAERANERRALVAQTAAAASRHSALTHYHQEIHQGPPGDGALALPPGDAPPLELPGLMELGQVLGQGWQPTAQSILLGLGPGGTLLTVPAGDALCHITFAGPTGVGKTNLMRLFLTQLLAAGCEVALLDPHFTPHNPTTGEDWQPIAARLAGGQGAVSDKAHIMDVLEGVARQELPARLDRWHRGQVPGPPRFYALEEAPALADYDKRFMEYVRPLLREGRKLGLYVIMASQDMLVSTLGTSSGVRSQFQTCYYGGGDPYSAKALLGFAPPNPPGKGVVWLRSSVTQEPALVRVPLVSNESITRLLPPPAPQLPPTVAADLARVYRALQADPATAQTAATAPPAGPELPEKARAAIQSLQAGQSLPDAIEAAYGVSRRNPNKYGPAYEEVQAAIRALISR